MSNNVFEKEEEKLEEEENKKDKNEEIKYRKPRRRI